MSNNAIVSIELLPVELLHRIFDNLDAETIVLSIRLVCHLFQSVVHTYNRYTLNFKLTSKSNFYLLCRLIHPNNVISLTLSNDETTSNQIDLFISLVPLQQFTHLRSLTLLRIDENQLNVILKVINFNFLHSFSFSIREYNDTHKNTTENLLSSTIAQSPLHKLDLNMSADRLLKILWPVNCTIQYLTINTDMNTNDLNHILQYCPHLHTLIMKKMPTIVSSNQPSINFRQLTSLTIETVDVTIDKLEIFLLLTSSLTHLQVIDGKQMMDGQRWESFIERNLLQLTKFEFYFTELRSTVQTLADVELIITSFQTSFWIEHKKWFVTCEFSKEHPKIIYLSSLPFCKSSAYYLPKWEKISLSTYSVMTNNGLPMMDNIVSLGLPVNKPIADDIREKKATIVHPLFPNVTDINLEFDENWPLFSLQSLSIFIDISRIISMRIYSEYLNEYNENTWIDIGIFMEHAHNLSRLIIQGIDYTYINGLFTENMYSNLPRHVKHLEIPINDLNQIKIILNRCENLFTIKFHYEYTKLFQTIPSWFADNTIQTTCKENYGTTSVWLGKKKKNELV